MVPLRPVSGHATCCSVWHGQGQLAVRLLVRQHNFYALQALRSGSGFGQFDSLEVQRVAVEQNANVVLMDINMPIVDGLSATRELLRANPDIGVIILSMHHEEGHVFQALRAGARGYLLKTSRVSEVAGAVRAVASGLSLLDPTVTSSVVSEFKRMSSKQTPEDGLGQLSETEIKILQHVSAGMSNKEIANKLSLAESTVKNRLSVLFEKIGVLDRTQAAIYAITHGIAPTAVQSR